MKLRDIVNVSLEADSQKITNCGTAFEICTLFTTYF